MKVEKISIEGDGWFFSVFREDDPRIGNALHCATAVTVTTSMTVEEFHAWLRLRASTPVVQPISTCDGGLKDRLGPGEPPGYGI